MIKAVLKRVLSPGVRRSMRRQWLVQQHRNGSCACNVCGHRVDSFRSHGVPPRPAIRCPICGSKPCHRLIQAWLDEHADLIQSGQTVVHIAPQPELGRSIQAMTQQVGAAFKSGAINDPDTPLDITNLPFPDHSIDLLIACHVLNMLPNDEPAFREVHRVLQPGGRAILSVPIHCDVAEMIELPRDSTCQLRMATFGDPFMYRKYTQDTFRQRAQELGLEFRLVQPNNLTHNPTHWQLADESLHLLRKAEL